MTVQWEGWAVEELLRQAEQVSEQARHIPGAARRLSARGEAGNGSVSVEVDGTGRLVSADIDARQCRDGDVERLGRLIVEALGEAERTLAARREALMDEITFAGVPIRRFSEPAPRNGR